MEICILLHEITVPHFSLHSLISALWSNQTGKRWISKVVWQVWNYSDIKFHPTSFNIHGNMNTFAWNYCAARVCFFSLHSLISALWSNKTGERWISKAVQQVCYYSNINFYRDSLNIHEVMLIFCNIFVQTFCDVIKTAWSNITGFVNEQIYLESM